MFERAVLGGALVVGALCGADAHAQSRNYVAVVVGLSTYEKLPKEVELDFARSDAATVAQALRDQARFTQVFLLRDGEATQAAIRETLRQKVPQYVGANDVFVLYFAGHGVGADLDTPVLLAYDSTLENGQQDGLELTAFVRDFQTWIHAGSTIIVTDAIHRNQLDGISFYGPAANQWPAMPQNTLIISSSQASSPAKDGAFGQVFAQAVSGGADTDRDRAINAGELVAFLTGSMADSGQTPVAAGTFDPLMPVAADVSGATSVSYVTEGVAKAPEPVYPDISLKSAKFVWFEGAAQSIQCREQPIVACSPSCVVWNFLVGPCDITAVIDGTQMTGRVPILTAGKYDCGRKGGDLTCTIAPVTPQ
jgi:hypothetical protein